MTLKRKAISFPQVVSVERRECTHHALVSSPWQQDFGTFQLLGLSCKVADRGAHLRALCVRIHHGNKGQNLHSYLLRKGHGPG